MAKKAKQAAPAPQPTQGEAPVPDPVAPLPAPRLRRPGGRPAFPWTPELENFILEGVVSNLSLGRIIEEGEREFPEGFPSSYTVKTYLASNNEFSTRYARAKDMSQDFMAEDIIDIIDGRHSDFRQADLDERKASVEERKWVMGKLRRKKWGEVKTTEITGADGTPLIQPQVIDTRSMTPEAQAALYQALQIVAAQEEAEDTEYTEEEPE
jgi:hypothetical protein